MKKQTLYLTTILSLGITLGYTNTLHATENISTKTVTTASVPISNQAIADPSVAAVSFVEHINYARVALAMKNIDLARQHTLQASNIVTLIKEAAGGELVRVTEVDSGRIIYQYDTEYKYHYFPIQAGLVQVKQVSNGPTWAENVLAVTDADIVYLTVNFAGDKVENFLKDVEVAIAAEDLKAADKLLAELTDAVIIVDSKISVPKDKARDNISLARNFIAGKNYDGARFALKHADDALDEMQKDEGYKSRHPIIANMRKDVSDLQSYITKKDPNMIQQADAKLEGWWKELKSWSKDNK